MKNAQTKILYIILIVIILATSYLLIGQILKIAKEKKEEIILAQKEKERIQKEQFEKERIEKEKQLKLTKFLQENTIPIKFDNSTIPTEGKAILADLDEMTITLIENGNVFKQYPIAAKGQENSRYETPIGKYQIDLKEEKHYIPSRDIYMPYSLHFFGNFFIHGMPYYRKTKKELFNGPSGGCIRLKTSDSKEVFEFAEKNTPLFIIEETNNKDLTDIEKLQDVFSKADKSTLNINANSYLVADIETGLIFDQKNYQNKDSIFSLSKLMTVILIDHLFRDDHQIIIDSYINDIETTSKYVKTGDTFTVTELLYPLILEQDDLTAYSISTSIGSKFFSNLMNEKAKAISMENTYFSDPAGMENSNISTPKDIFYLLKNIYNKNKYSLKLTTKKEYSLDSSDGHSAYSWTNETLKDNGYVLYYKDKNIKDDNQTSSAVVITNIYINNKKTPIAIIVLNSSNTDEDIENLIKYTEDNFKTF